MARWISTDLRQTIAERAKQLCEYCLIAEEDTFYGCEVDHIISLKHGGASELHNLAYACALCNRAKGSDIASISTSGEISRFFNPRTDSWATHCKFSFGFTFCGREINTSRAEDRHSITVSHVIRVLSI